MFLKHLYGQWLNHLPGQSIPAPDHSFGLEIFPYIQPEPLPDQLEAIPFCPIVSFTGEEADSHLRKISLQVVIEYNNISPVPPLLQTNQSQFFQPLPTEIVLQIPHQLHCPSHDMFQGLDVFLIVSGPKLKTALKMWPHWSWVQGDNHLPGPAGNPISYTSLDNIVLLDHLGKALVLGLF